MISLIRYILIWHASRQEDLPGQMRNYDFISSSSGVQSWDGSEVRPLFNLGRTVEDVDACIQDSVGFSPPCSRTWAYNAINDGEHCRKICLTSLFHAEPYNLEDGSLNGCLQCDEDVSGPVFKATAGRTRRNSGVAAAICRPCETVWRIDHKYDG